MSKVKIKEKEMSEETTNLLLALIRQQGEDIKELKEKVNQLVAFQNKLIAGGVVLSALFGFLWDWFKNFFGRN